MGIIGILNAILGAVAVYVGHDYLAVAFIVSGNIYIAADRVIKEFKAGE